MHEPIHTISLKDVEKPVVAAPQQPIRQEARRFHRALPTLLTLIVLAGTAYLIYDFLNPRFSSVSTQETARTDVAAPASADTADIVARVARLMVLPTGESPTIAAVTDLAPLAGQPFFINAKVGDIVLLYHQAKKAILYDPQADRIVEAGPIAQ